MKKKVSASVEETIFNLAKKKRLMGKTAAVIAAGGTSSRMGDINKLFAEIEGIPVLAMTISVFEKCRNISEIVVVANESDIVAAADLCAQYKFRKVTKVVKGGENRVQSVANGLKAVSDDVRFAAIQDGARPFVTEKIIDDTIAAAIKYGGAAPCVPVKDTVKKAQSGVVVDTPERSTLFSVQTPQTFDIDLIKTAIFNAVDKNIPITDDCSAVEAIGGKVVLTDGSYENIKITVPSDLVLAKAIYLERQ